MKNPRISAMKRGFTLIELLVVIVIIALLAAMSYGPIMKVIADSKRQAARKTATDLCFAVESFYKGYEYLPYESAETADTAPDTDTAYTTDNGDLLRVLMGQDEDINTKGIEYFSTDTAKNGVNGLVFDGSADIPEALVDPFGNYFTILIDYDMDNKLEASDLNAVFSEVATIRSRTSIAATPGPDKTWGVPAGEKADDDVVTW